MGGYYIVNGQEKVIRMLILPRRNYVSFESSETPHGIVGREWWNHVKSHAVVNVREMQLCTCRHFVRFCYYEELL